jgi:hypothetical protein
MELSREVSDALAIRGIRAVTTALGEWECDQEDMDKLRRDIAVERNRIAALQAQLANCQVEAEIEQKRIEIEGARRKLNLIEIQELVKLLGPAQVATERILAEWAKMGMPQTLVVGADGDLGNALLQSMPFAQARDMLMAMAAETGKQVAQAQAEADRAQRSMVSNEVSQDLDGVVAAADADIRPDGPADPVTPSAPG